MGTHPNTSHLQALGEPAGRGTLYEELMAVAVADTPSGVGPRHREQGYTSSQPLLDMEYIPVVPTHHDTRTDSFNSLAPTPYPWAPKFLPE